MAASHVLTWEVTESRGYETSWIELRGTTLRARGRAVGTAPEPYWISYELETGEDYVTSQLRVHAANATGSHELLLLHDGSGRWTANGEHVSDTGGALDCDLGLSPLTNTMPVLRHGLHLAPGEQTCLMAWVAVPDLTVHASRQTYTHLTRTESGALVRFASGEYRSDLEFDMDGLVIDYPGLAHRLSGSAERFQP
ncbi:putative glycolipid-binding domain-containing protein [Streptomyces sp. NBC_01142]|uniref:putative glycolipid-binding domain-containing protein n=1 Tax=Streptomyces sp. NBC_01142 TaxID=2975865 RepID=UPI002257E6CB|nr:putative glycolipid-binding domain-containing protein [Streptomyces sp. NBC_01142]MCX4821201.1 putative glycolipid-binding domain-containing protein [Streptomyces sp. NBC_01142]